jgi:hypothetical protein
MEVIKVMFKRDGELRTHHLTVSFLPRIGDHICVAPMDGELKELRKVVSVMHEADPKNNYVKEINVFCE